VGITIVNNTGNTSYEVVNHALSYLEKYNKKKIIILGQTEVLTNEGEYKSFGKKIAHICTHAFFYQVARESLLRSIVRKERGKCKVYSAGDRKELVDMLQKTVAQGDIILFEGNTNDILTSFLGIASELF
jgi:UDP-N-acetylmuramyl pentapeptide synthase